MSDDTGAAADFLNELAEKNGVACATVDDGHVLIFKTETLERLLESSRKSGKVVVFVKRQDMQ